MLFLITVRNLKEKEVSAQIISMGICHLLQAREEKYRRKIVEAKLKKTNNKEDLTDR